jgi:imidazolonepropionase-like amidohydrolase
MSTFVLRGANVLDEAGGFVGPIDVAVRDGIVAQVGPDLAGDGGRSIDAEGLWVMPGVFDCHVHPAIWSRDQMELLRTPVTEWALGAADALARTLRAGVTFVRDAGGADAGLRAGIERGFAVGPHLQLTVVLLSQTGGQMDGFLAGPGLEIPTGYLVPDYPGRPPWRADGVDEMRRAVRAILRAGADWVKLCAGTGAHVEGQDWNGVEYTEEEVATAVAEAARAGRFVMADSKTPASIEMCVRAGVRSIEHGLFLDEERAQLMARNGVWLVPTHSVYRDFLDKIEQGSVGPKVAAAVQDMMSRSGDLVRIAQENGVRIALGSDAFGNEMHGNNLRELLYLHEAGMSVEDVLLTATARGAELCGVADRYGRIAPGHVFDAIVLEQDPSDLHVFAAPDGVAAVFKAGVLHGELPQAVERGAV